MNEFRTGFRLARADARARRDRRRRSAPACSRAYGLDALEDDPELTAIARFAAQLCGSRWRRSSTSSRPSGSASSRAKGSTLTESRDADLVSCCVHAMLRRRADGSARRHARRALRRQSACHRRAATSASTPGYPLISPEGVPLGALCVIDPVPRPEGLTELQREGLEVLAQAVMRRLRARREELETAARARAARIAPARARRIRSRRSPGRPTARATSTTSTASCSSSPATTRTRTAGRSIPTTSPPPTRAGRNACEPARLTRSSTASAATTANTAG